MNIRNVHQRTLSCAPEEAGALIDSLASPDDRLWPVDRWPAMRFDRGLVPGARGGHGPIRYEVAAHIAGREARFTFTGSGLTGQHWLELDCTGTRPVLRHVIQARVHGRLVVLWALAIRWLHDALVEDALDRADGLPPRRFPPHVRILRALMQACWTALPNAIHSVHDPRGGRRLRSHPGSRASRSRDPQVDGQGAA